MPRKTPSSKRVSIPISDSCPWKSIPIKPSVTGRMKYIESCSQHLLSQMNLGYPPRPSLTSTCMNNHHHTDKQSPTRARWTQVRQEYLPPYKHTVEIQCTGCDLWTRSTCPIHNPSFLQPWTFLCEECAKEL
jgi:hypothetical protein